MSALLQAIWLSGLKCTSHSHQARDVSDVWCTQTTSHDGRQTTSLRKWGTEVFCARQVGCKGRNSFGKILKRRNLWVFVPTQQVARTLGNPYNQHTKCSDSWAHDQCVVLCCVVFCLNTRYHVEQRFPTCHYKICRCGCWVKVVPAASNKLPITWCSRNLDQKGGPSQNLRAWIPGTESEAKKNCQTMKLILGWPRSASF